MLNALLVGLGARGQFVLGNDVFGQGRWRLAGGVDPHEQSRQVTKQIAPELRLFSDYDHALDECECDAVVLFTPAQLHHQHVRSALQAGKHVLVEKPFAHSHREAIALVRLAEQKRLKLAVDQNLRYLPLIRVLRTAIASGELGAIGYVSLINNRYRPDPRNLEGLAHAWLLENAVHDWDQLLAILQLRPVRVTVREFDTPWSGYQQGAAHALIDFEGGVHAIIEGSFISQSNDFHLRIGAERGTVIADSYQAYRMVHGESQKRWEMQVDPTGGTLSVADAFADWVHGGPEPECSGRNNLRTVQLVRAGIISAQRLQPVEIPQADDEAVD